MYSLVILGEEQQRATCGSPGSGVAVDTDQFDNGSTCTCISKLRGSFRKKGEGRKLTVKMLGWITSLALTPHAMFTSSKGGRMTLFAPHPLK